MQVDLNRAVAQFFANLRAHARDEMSQPPVVLMAQGVANGLNAILDPGLGGPPTLNGGGVLVNSAGQAVSPIFSGMPSNVMSSSKEDEGDVFTSPQGSNAGSGAEGQQSATNSAGFTIEPKIAGQMGTRGWTSDSIASTVASPARTIVMQDTRFDPIAGVRRNDPATAYVNADGSYVVVNNKDGTVVQISNRNNSNWKAPWAK